MLPQANPINKPAEIAKGIGSPVPRTLANTTPENAIIEPTDKSIPAVIITKVKPTAIIALMDVC